MAIHLPHRPLSPEAKPSSSKLSGRPPSSVIPSCFCWPLHNYLHDDRLIERGIVLHAATQFMRRNTNKKTSANGNSVPPSLALEPDLSADRNPTDQINLLTDNHLIPLARDCNRLRRRSVLVLLGLLSPPTCSVLCVARRTSQLLFLFLSFLARARQTHHA
jgi:hypothetical protein